MTTRPKIEIPKDMIRVGYESAKRQAGAALAAEIEMVIGNPETGDVYADDAKTKIYAHIAGEEPSGLATLPASAIPIAKRTYGRPILVKPTARGTYRFVGLDDELDAEYSVGDSSTPDGEPVWVSQIRWGTIQPTGGLSVFVTGAFYDDTFVPDIVSDDFDGTVLDTLAVAVEPPTTNNRVKFVLVQLDVTTPALEFKQSSEYNAGVSFDVALSQGLLPTKDADRKRLGWIRLVTGVSVLGYGDIYNAPEWIGGGGGVNALDDLSDVDATSPTANDFLRFDGANWSVVKNNVTTTAPTVTDDTTQGYSVGSQWLNTGDDALYICTDATASAAVWLHTGEVNTVSNVGATGVGVFKQKVGADFQFKNIRDGDNTVSVFNNTTLNTIDLGVAQANLTHDLIGGTLGIAKGGTGQTAQTAAFDALAPTTTKGDLIVHNGTDNIRVAVGTDGQALIADSGETAGVRFGDAGSAYVADGIAFTDPTTQTWTALNQGSGTYTEDTTNKRMTILEDGDGSADLRGWYASAPSAPYAIRMHCKYWGNGASNMLAVGFRENSTGELHVIIFGQATGVQFAVQKWNSATSVNSNYIAATTVLLMPEWFKIEDNNTNRIISISDDGIVWTQIHSIGRTDFLTADEIFFGVFITTNAAYDTQVSLLSYEEL